MAMANHYLAGSCEGISIHTEGCTTSVRDARGVEAKSKTFPTEDAASKALWLWRDALYRKYDAIAQGTSVVSQ